MQIKKFISLLTFSLFSAQTCLPMDAPTKDDGEFAHLKNQSQDGSQQITVIQKNDGQRKILTSLEEIKAKMKSDIRFTPSFIDLLIKCAPEDIKEFVNAVTFDSDVLLTEPKEIIFSGPSGIEKSELAKAIAYKLRFYYFGWSANTGDTYQNSASTKTNKTHNDLV